jgi:hypothetical protein
LLGNRATSIVGTYDLSLPASLEGSSVSDGTKRAW